MRVGTYAILHLYAGEDDVSELVKHAALITSVLRQVRRSDVVYFDVLNLRVT